MAGQRSRRVPRTRRGLAPRVEGLDRRELLSTAGLGPGLGHYVDPGPPPSGFRGRILRQPQAVDAHRAINRALASRLGPGLDRIERQVELQGTAAPNSLSERVLGQPFVHAVLRSNDAYTLLSAPWLEGVFGPQALVNGSADQSVTIELPRDRVLALGDPSLVEVRPGDPAPGLGNSVFSNGFLLEVPSSSIVFTPSGTAIVTVNVGQIPAAARGLSGAPVPLNDLYKGTGPLLLDALRGGEARRAPTGLTGVPGLRLTDALRSPRLFPPDATRARFFQMMRVAVDRKLAAPDPAQRDRIGQGVEAFQAVIGNWAARSSAQLERLKAEHPGAGLVPASPSGPLTGTFGVSTGVVQPNSASLPERIEIGYVFARNGDYGLALSARGPLSTAPTAVGPTGAIGGDIQVEVSNATTLRQLDGWRIVEGTYEGSVLAGGLESTHQDGVATFAASAGYGAGLEYGLGVRFTQVIPLGNVFGHPIR